jgi:hypothetical protein
MAQVVEGAGRDLSLCTGTDCLTSFARSPSQKCHAAPVPPRMARASGDLPGLRRSARRTEAHLVRRGMPVTRKVGGSAI